MLQQSSVSAAVIYYYYYYHHHALYILCMLFPLVVVKDRWQLAPR